MLKLISKKQFIALLRQHGYKATPQRIAIFDVLKQIDHPSADEIYERLQENYPSISMATLYQTLHLFADLGLIFEMTETTHRAKYETNTTPHINIICPVCGKITDFEDEMVVEFWELVKVKMEKEPVGHRFEVFIVCNECEAKQLRPLPKSQRP